MLEETKNMYLDVKDQAIINKIQKEDLKWEIMEKISNKIQFYINLLDRNKQKIDKQKFLKDMEDI